MLGELRSCNGLSRDSAGGSDAASNQVLRRKEGVLVNGNLVNKQANGEARKLSAAERLGVAIRRPASITEIPTAPPSEVLASSSSSTASNSSSPVPPAVSMAMSSGSTTPTPSPARRPNNITGSPRRAVTNGRPLSAAELVALGVGDMHNGPRSVVEALIGRSQASSPRPTITIKPQPLRRSSLIEDAQKCAKAAAAAVAAAANDYFWMDDPLNVARTTTADHVEHARRRNNSLEHVRRRSSPASRPPQPQPQPRPASVAATPEGWSPTPPAHGHSFSLYTPPAPLPTASTSYVRYTSPGGLPRRAPKNLSSSTSVPAQLSAGAAVPLPQAAPRRPPTFQAPPPPAPPSPRRPAGSAALPSSVSSPSLRSATSPRSRPHSFPSSDVLGQVLDQFLDHVSQLDHQDHQDYDSGYRSLPSDHLTSPAVLRALYLSGMRPSPTFHGLTALSAALGGPYAAPRPRPASIAHLLTPVRPLPPHKLNLFYDILDQQERFAEVCVCVCL